MSCNSALGADIDNNETKQFINVVPLVSGSKNSKDNKDKVKFTTLYKENFDALDTGNNNFVSFSIEFANIETIGLFNPHLHDRLLKEDKIVYDWT